MYFLKNKEDCCGCSACLNICPKECIEFKSDEEGFDYPYIKKNGQCIECKLCEKVCAILNKKNESVKPKSYACRNKNKQVIKESSSGGIFSLLSELVLKNEGIVFGAMFDKNFEVYHGWINNIDELGKLRGSKYVQSNLKNSYKEVKKFLDQKKEVLFSGTPCQIGGLYSYLRKPYENLITVDVVCHAVPSPMIFRKYKDYLKFKYKSNIKKFTFRCKDEGWTNYKLKFEFENGKIFSQYGYENLYMKGFVKDLYTRPSCTACRFKSFSSGSDITLGDYWGGETKFKEFNDNKGISLLLINTNKGEKIFQDINSNIEFKKTNIEHAIEYNPCIVSSIKRHKKSKKFYKNLRDDNFDETVITCLKKRKETKVEYYIRAIINTTKIKLGYKLE